jgi:chemotaxis protein MotB
MEEQGNEAPIRIVRKKKGHAGHHGGAWKVAYADFVTAMMALFIVLWIVGQSKQVKEYIANYFKDPGAAFENTKASLNGGKIGAGEATAEEFLKRQEANLQAVERDHEGDRGEARAFGSLEADQDRGRQGGPAHRAPRKPQRGLLRRGDGEHA